MTTDTPTDRRLDGRTILRHKTKLTTILRALVRVSLQATDDECALRHPCSGLIEQGMLRGVGAIAGDLLRDREMGTLPLNGSGLILSARMSADDGLQVRVGGPQYRYYGVTGPRLRLILVAEGVDNGDDDDHE